MAQELTTTETLAENPIDFDIENNSTTIAKPIPPCGTLYVTICFKPDQPDKIDYILVVGESKHNCGNSFLEAIANLTTYAIRRIRNIHEAQSIIKNLRYHKCNSIIANKDHVTSCVDAIGQILEQFLLKDEKETETQAAIQAATEV